MDEVTLAAFEDELEKIALTVPGMVAGGLGGAGLGALMDSKNRTRGALIGGGLGALGGGITGHAVGKAADMDRALRLSALADSTRRAAASIERSNATRARINEVVKRINARQARMNRMNAELDAAIGRMRVANPKMRGEGFVVLR